MIQQRTLTLAVIGLLAVFLAPSALAAKSPHRYSPKHGAKCRKGYKRVVKRSHVRHRRGHAVHRRHRIKRKVFCVKRHGRPARKIATPLASPSPAPAAAQEKVKLHSHLDPTYTRNPLNPFEITYAYSASATAEVQGLAAAEEPAPLPSGVLSLFSDGKLECAINVGSGVEGSECPVFYQALGDHSVTTIYTSGEESATETEVETIEPLATTTTLEVSYEPLAEPQSDFGCSGVHCEFEARRYTDNGLDIGTLEIHATTSLPEATPVAACLAEGCFTVDLDAAGNASLAVRVLASFTAEEEKDLAVGESLSISPESVECVGIQHLFVFTNCGSTHSAAAIEGGDFSLRVVSPTRSGYAPSEAIAPIQFTPAVGESVIRVAMP